MALNKSENKKGRHVGRDTRGGLCALRNVYMKWRIHLTARALLAFDN